MAEPIKLHLLRQGRPYESLDQQPLVDHRSGETLAMVSQANAGLIVADLLKTKEARRSVCDRLGTLEAIEICERAAELFLTAELACGNSLQSPDDFVQWQSATTAMPVAMCRLNMQKIYRAMKNAGAILSSLTMNLDFSILDQGYGHQGGRMTSYLPKANHLAVILPNNSPGVHALWIPALPLRMPLILKPGGTEPWTPNRICQAMIEAGYPCEAIGYYPTGHGPVSSIYTRADKIMCFGDEGSVRKWAGDPRVEVHGPGHSKIILGEDVADHWEEYLDLMVESIAANGGRSCINTSSVLTPRHGEALAGALAARLAEIKPAGLQAERASLAGFSNPTMAAMIESMIESNLQSPGAVDYTAKYRQGPRLVEIEGTVFLQPTLIWAEDPDHPLGHKEFMFPFASVLELPLAKIEEDLDDTLIATVITDDPRLKTSMIRHRKINRLNIGAIPTPSIDWDQPHEGNLFDFLLERRAFQTTGP